MADTANNQPQQPQSAGTGGTGQAGGSGSPTPAAGNSVQPNNAAKQAGGGSLADRMQKVNQTPNQNSSATGGSGGAANQSNQPAQPASQPAPGMRTMASDMNKQGQAGASQPATPTPGQTNFTPAGMDADEPVFTPETSNAMSSAAEPDLGGKSHTLWWIIGAVVGLVILGLVGYFFVYPILVPDTTDAPITEQPTDPSSEQPEDPVVVPHTSAFLQSPASRVTVSIGDTLTDPAISSALTREAENVPVGLSEIIFTDNAGSQLPFSDFLTAVAPSGPTAENSAALFDDDFTAFIYKDDGGAWPGYIATLSSTDTDALTRWFEALEVTDLSEFFLTSPDGFAEFRNGTVLGLADRYAPAVDDGISFGYLAHENRVLMSTSFDGMKEAVELLGWASGQ